MQYRTQTAILYDFIRTDNRAEVRIVPDKEKKRGSDFGGIPEKSR